MKLLKDKSKENLDNKLIIRKVKETPTKYPRKAGIPAKQPL